ncbi:MAG: hypothetical protein ABI866_05660 [Dokdonella sp.]
MKQSRPSWYTDEDDSTWDRIKGAFKNDWEQTKNDFGSDTARDLNQDVGDTVKQAVGADNAFENREQAFRFGHGARRNFAGTHSVWDNDLETRLRSDYQGDFDRDRADIRRAYEYKY